MLRKWGISSPSSSSLMCLGSMGSMNDAGFSILAPRLAKSAMVLIDAAVLPASTTFTVGPAGTEPITVWACGSAARSNGSW